jgi:hypothetical protein
MSKRSEPRKKGVVFYIDKNKSAHKMNEQYAMLESGSDRSNKEIEAAVNRGLAACMLSGVAVGAVVMREGGVPLHVCARVLGSPGQRRASDWQQNAPTSPTGR